LAIHRLMPGHLDIGMNKGPSSQAVPLKLRLHAEAKNLFTFGPAEKRLMPCFLGEEGRCRLDTGTDHVIVDSEGKFADYRRQKSAAFTKHGDDRAGYGSTVVGHRGRRAFRCSI
jgi:hypothetical protein